MLENGNWRASENLKVGDRIVTSNDNFEEVVSSELVSLDEAELIYNLNVDEYHTYFVGEEGLLVHNNCSEELTRAIRTYANKSTSELISAARNIINNRGFDSFTSLKNFLGSPSTNCQWHHLVEQSQITKSGFSTQNINNLQNIVSLPSGSGSVHAQISGYFSSKQDFTNGLRVRDWLAGQSFDDQLEFGLDLLRDFGDVVPTTNGWVFIPR